MVTEARRHAVAYLDEIGGNYKGEAAQSLQQASSSYSKALDSLTKLSQMFPLMGPGRPADIGDPQVRKQAVDLIKEALKWEREAIRALESATEL